MTVVPDGWTVADLPQGGPATVEAVKVHLKIAADDVRDDALMAPIVQAVNSLVRSWPVSVGVTVDPGWPGHITLGSTMLASRLWRRRSSPSGVEAFAEQGAVYVQRNDPDVAMLLQLGNYAKPQVG